MPNPTPTPDEPGHPEYEAAYESMLDAAGKPLPLLHDHPPHLQGAVLTTLAFTDGMFGRLDESDRQDYIIGVIKELRENVTSARQAELNYPTYGWPHTGGI